MPGVEAPAGDPGALPGAVLPIGGVPPTGGVVDAPIGGVVAFGGGCAPKGGTGAPMDGDAPAVAPIGSSPGPGKPKLNSFSG